MATPISPEIKAQILAAQKQKDEAAMLALEEKKAQDLAERDKPSEEKPPEQVPP